MVLPVALYGLCNCTLNWTLRAGQEDPQPESVWTETLKKSRLAIKALAEQRQLPHFFLEKPGLRLSSNRNMRFLSSFPVIGRCYLQFWNPGIIMPNILRLLVVVLALGPTASLAETIAECSVPDAMTPSFPGAAAGEEKADWRQIAHGQGVLRLVRDDAGVDLVLADSGGAVYSVRAGSGKLALTEGRQGTILHVVIERNGALDHFLFEEEAHGKGSLFWTGGAQPTGYASSHGPGSVSTKCVFL